MVTNFSRILSTDPIVQRNLKKKQNNDKFLKPSIVNEKVGTGPQVSTQFRQGSLDRSYKVRPGCDTGFCFLNASR